MTTPDLQVSAVSLPTDSRAVRCYAKTDLADAYEIALPPGASTNPEVLARFLFAEQPPWVVPLMRVRDAVVGRLGIKTSTQLREQPAGSGPPRVGIFRIYEASPTEILLGEDDSHLDFRLSALLRSHSASTDSRPTGAGPDDRYLVLTTVVHCHNWIGRLYILVIAPFHRMVVKSTLRRGARRGWPSA